MTLDSFQNRDVFSCNLCSRRMRLGIVGGRPASYVSATNEQRTRPRPIFLTLIVACSASGAQKRYLSTAHSTHSRAHISSPSVAAEFGNSLKNECAQIFSVVVSRLLCPDSAMMMTTTMMMMMPVSNPTRSAVERRRLPRNPVFAAYPPTPARRPKYS